MNPMSEDFTSLRIGMRIIRIDALSIRMNEISRWTYLSGSKSMKKKKKRSI